MRGRYRRFSALGVGVGDLGALRKASLPWAGRCPQVPVEITVPSSQLFLSQSGIVDAMKSGNIRLRTVLRSRGEVKKGGYQ